MAEQQAGQQGGGGRGVGGALKSKLGPFPVWAWLLIVTAVVVVWVLWSRNKNSQQGQGLAPEVAIVSNRFGTQPPSEPKKKHKKHDHDNGDHDHHHGKGDGDRIEDNPRWDRRSDRKHPDASDAGAKKGKLGGTTPAPPAQDTAQDAGTVMDHDPEGGGQVPVPPLAQAAPATAPSPGQAPGS